MTDEAHGLEAQDPRKPKSYGDKWRGMPWKSRMLVVGAGAAMLAIGAAGGATGAGLLRPEPVTYEADLAVTPIADLAAGDRVALNGTVVEIFGNKFVVEDGAARALVETGRLGEGGDLVVAGEPVTVQGRFDNGFLHATSIRHANGEIETLAPPPPPHGPKPGRP